MDANFPERDLQVASAYLASQRLGWFQRPIRFARGSGMNAAFLFGDVGCKQ